jgi:hypothetical protein
MNEVKHGGKRKGSGRPKSEPTMLLRIPVRLRDELVCYIQDHPLEDKINKNSISNE